MPCCHCTQRWCVCPLSMPQGWWIGRFGPSSLWWGLALLEDSSSCTFSAKSTCSSGGGWRLSTGSSLYRTAPKPSATEGTGRPRSLRATARTGQRRLPLLRHKQTQEEWKRPLFDDGCLMLWVSVAEMFRKGLPPGVFDQSDVIYITKALLKFVLEDG